MSVKKRGGAHLDKNIPTKDVSHSREPASPAQKQRKRLTKKQIAGLLVALGVVAILLVGLFVKLVADSLFAEDGLLGGLPSVPGYNDSVDPDSGGGPTRSEADSVRKPEFYTFLVVGRDTGGGGNTDTIMFCSYDIHNQKATVMSIPRDTLVDARHPNKNKKINGVWNLGLYYAPKGSAKKGIDYLKEAVGDMTGIVPDFYVVVNWEAFGRLVDAIGGVDFDVPFEMKYRDPTQNLVIDQAAGHRHLSGSDAMQVVRWRHNNSGSVQYADADLGRIRTQQALMKEIISKCLKIENITKINEFVEIFAEEVETDLTVGNLLAFAQRAISGGLDMDNVIFTTMPVTAAGGGSVQAKPEELLGVLNDSLNPYVKDLDMTELRVLQQGSKGYYIYQGSGTGTAPVYSEVKPAQAVTTHPENDPEPAGNVPAGAALSPNASASTAPGSASSSAPSGTLAPSAEGSPAPTGSQSPAEERAPEPTKAPAEPAPVPEHDPMDMGIPMD